MALDIDTTTPLRTPDQLANLILAIRNAEPQDETHWLEWKCGVDLSQREWQARVARFILGVANRPQRIAALVVGGCGYLVLGAEPGRLESMALPDSASLGDGLRRYIGPNRPPFTAIPVVVEGHVIVVIIVEPTGPADRPFLALGTFERDGKTVIKDGRVYIRRPGQTEEADHRELEEMVDQRVKGTEPGWSLRLEGALAGDFVCVDWLGDAQDRWIESERQRLTGKLPISPATIERVFGFSLESRSKEEFRAQVDRYLDGIAERLVLALVCGLDFSDRSILSIEGQNDDEHGLEAVIVELDMPVSVYAIGSYRDILREARSLRPPRPYGDSTSYVDLAIAPIVRELPSDVKYQTNETGQRVILPAQPIPPYSHRHLQSLTVLVPASYSGQRMGIGWRAHSSDRRGVAFGELGLDIPNLSLTIDEAFRHEPT